MAWLQSTPTQVRPWGPYAGVTGPRSRHSPVVDTPSVFCEYELPANEEEWTARDRRKMARLERLAEKHRASIQIDAYQRG